MGFIARNITTGPPVDVPVDDLGITIRVGEDHNLSALAASDVQNSVDLPAAISAASVVILDPLDDTTPLSMSDSIDAVTSANNPHFRINGGTLDQLDDVDLTGGAPGDLLQFNVGGIAIAVPPDVAVDGVVDFRETVQSGLTVGGVITLATATTVDIEAGSGFIVDSYTDPLNPVKTEISWLAISGVTVTQAADVGFTTIAIDNTGSVVQVNGPLNNSQERIVIKLGRAYFENGSIDSVFSSPRVVNQTSNNFYDYLSFLAGDTSKGLSVQKVTDQLSVFRGAGERFIVGVAWNVDSSDPNTESFPAAGDSVTPAPLETVLRDGSVVATGVTVIPKTYDDGTATPASINGKQTIIHYLLENAGGARYLQLGQTVYADFKKASDALFNDATGFIFFPNAESAGFALLAQILVAADAADFEDVTKAGINNILGEGGIANSSGSQSDELVKVNAADQIPDYLANKAVAGSGMTINVINPAANEQLEFISSYDPATSGYRWLIDDITTQGAIDEIQKRYGVVSSVISATVALPSPLTEELSIAITWILNKKGLQQDIEDGSPPDFTDTAARLEFYTQLPSDFLFAFMRGDAASAFSIKLALEVLFTVPGVYPPVDVRREYIPQSSVAWLPESIDIENTQEELTTKATSIQINDKFSNITYNSLAVFQDSPVIPLFPVIENGKVTYGEEFVVVFDEFDLPVQIFFPYKQILGEDLVCGSQPVSYSQYTQMAAQVAILTNQGLTGWNPDPMSDFPDYQQADIPIMNVTWFDAIAFCNVLSEFEELVPYYTLINITFDSDGHIVSGIINIPDPLGDGYRLPYEFEWEYIAKGGTEAVLTGFSGINDANKLHDDYALIYDGYIGPEITDVDFTSHTIVSGDYWTLSSITTDYHAWYTIDAVSEITDVDFTSNSIVASDYWTLNSTTNNFYVWYIFSPTPEITDVDFTSHTIVASDYWTINTISTVFHVWYTVDAVGTDPTPVSSFGIQVDILSTDTAAQIAIKTQVVLDSLPSFSVPVPGANIITVTNSTPGPAVDAADVNAGVGITVVSQGTVQTGTDPAPGGVGIQVDLVTGDGPSVIATKTAIEINGTPVFSVPAPGANILTVTNTQSGSVTDAADVNAGVGITVTTQGVNGGVDPAPVGSTSIQVDILSTDTPSDIAIKSANEIGSLQDFLTSQSGAVITVATAKFGNVTDAADVNAGVLVTVTQQGQDNTAIATYITSNIATRKPNELLIRNMCGGVSEWVFDGDQFPDLSLELQEAAVRYSGIIDDSDNRIQKGGNLADTISDITPFLIPSNESQSTSFQELFHGFRVVRRAQIGTEDVTRRGIADSDLYFFSSDKGSSRCEISTFWADKDNDINRTPSNLFPNHSIDDENIVHVGFPDYDLRLQDVVYYNYEFETDTNLVEGDSVSLGTNGNVSKFLDPTAPFISQFTTDPVVGTVVDGIDLTENNGITCYKNSSDNNLYVVIGVFSPGTITWGTPTLVTTDDATKVRVVKISNSEFIIGYTTGGELYPVLGTVTPGNPPTVSFNPGDRFEPSVSDFDLTRSKRGTDFVFAFIRNGQVSTEWGNVSSGAISGPFGEIVIDSQGDSIEVEATTGESDSGDILVSIRRTGSGGTIRLRNAYYTFVSGTGNAYRGSSSRTIVNSSLPLMGLQTADDTYYVQYLSGSNLTTRTGTFSRGNTPGNSSFFDAVTGTIGTLNTTTAGVPYTIYENGASAIVIAQGVEDSWVTVSTSIPFVTSITYIRAISFERGIVIYNDDVASTDAVEVFPYGDIATEEFEIGIVRNSAQAGDIVNVEIIFPIISTPVSHRVSEYFEIAGNLFQFITPHKGVLLRLRLDESQKTEVQTLSRQELGRLFLGVDPLSDNPDIDFVGFDVVETSPPDTVTVRNLFGSHFKVAESSTVSTTTSTTFQNKVTLTTDTLPAGTYRVAFNYGWNHNETITSSFEAQFLEDSTPIGEIHKQQPKDAEGVFGTAGTDQRHVANKVFYRTLTAGVHTFDLKYRSDTVDVASSVWEAVIEFWRVS